MKWVNCVQRTRTVFLTVIEVQFLDSHSETSSDKMALQATLHLHGCMIQTAALHGSMDYRNQPRLHKLMNKISDTVHHLKGELIKLMRVCVCL